MKAAFLAILIVSLLSFNQPAAEEITAFKNVNLVPMTKNKVISSQTVIVSGGRISRIGPARKVSVPAGATR